MLLFYSDRANVAANDHRCDQAIYPLNKCGAPLLSGVIERNTMKPRLLIRALCVGAALLVPAGGLAVLGVGTAGATGQTTLLVSGTIKIGPIGPATLPTKQCSPVTGPGTFQCSLAGIQATFRTTFNLTITLATLLYTITPKGTITAAVIQAGANVTISATGATAGFNGCKILTIPRIKFTKSGTKWIATTVSTTGVVIKTTACTTRTLLGTDIAGHKLSSSLSLSIKTI
jgi:hypothetical protein